MKEQIMQYITTAVASLGGITGIIAIACTLIKVFGGNSVKAKLSSSKIDLDKTMNSGLVDIEKKIVERMNTQVSVDISSLIADYVDKARSEDRLLITKTTKQLNGLQVATAQLLNSFAELTVLKAETKKQLGAEAQIIMESLEEIKEEVRPIATITLTEPVTEKVIEQMVEVEEKNQRVKVAL